MNKLKHSVIRLANEREGDSEAEKMHLTFEDELWT